MEGIPANILILAMAAGGVTKPFLDTVRLATNRLPSWFFPVFAFIISIVVVWILQETQGESVDTRQEIAATVLAGLIAAGLAIAQTAVQGAVERKKEGEARADIEAKKEIHRERQTERSRVMPVLGSPRSMTMTPRGWEQTPHGESSQEEMSGDYPRTTSVDREIHRRQQRGDFRQSTSTSMHERSDADQPGYGASDVQRRRTTLE